MDFENLNQKIGGCGLYQFIAFFLLSFTTFQYGLEMEAVTFSGFIPKFKCLMPTNLSSSENGTFPAFVDEDQCHYRGSLNESWTACSRWTFERDIMSTSLVSDFNMVCDRAYLKDLILTIYFSGCFSTYPLTMLSDKIGRNLLLIVFANASIVVTLWQVLASSLWQHFVAFFCAGAFKTVYVGMAFSTMIELMPMKQLDLAATNFWLWYGIGYMGSAVVAYYGRSWRIIFLFSLLLCGCYISYPCLIPETPRWLMLNEKKEKCYRVVKFMARVNGRRVDKSDFDKWQPIKEKTGNLLTFFKYRTMIYRLIIMNVASYSFNFAYLGSATDLTFASDNIFISTFVMGLIEVPSGPVAGAMANRCGRKLSVYILTGIGIACLMVIPFVESDIDKSSWQPWLKLSLAMTGKLGFTSAWLVFDIITCEIIPTTHRNSAMCVVYIAVGLGSIFAPAFNSLALKWHYAAPCLIYSAMLAVSVLLLAFFIPETYGLPIPQTMEQATSLVIHKEKQWKASMIEQLESLGVDSTLVKTETSAEENV